MKTLANCKPSEFLVQTNKIRKSVAKWLTITNLTGIYKKLPTLPKGVSDEEREKAVRSQFLKNVDSIFDAILEEHPEETLELLALMCFIDPADVDNYPVSEYLAAFAEIISDEAVLSFFISLAKLGQTNISISA